MQKHNFVIILPFAIRILNEEWPPKSCSTDSRKTLFSPEFWLKQKAGEKDLQLVALPFWGDWTKGGGNTPWFCTELFMYRKYSAIGVKMYIKWICNNSEQRFVNVIRQIAVSSFQLIWSHLDSSIAEITLVILCWNTTYSVFAVNYRMSATRLSECTFRCIIVLFLL